jgi:integrase
MPLFLAEIPALLAMARARDTAATWLVMEGVPLREIARLLGKSEAMVQQVYGKHLPGYLRRAVSALTIRKPPTPTL